MSQHPLYAMRVRQAALAYRFTNERVAEDPTHLFTDIDVPLEADPVWAKLSHNQLTIDTIMAYTDLEGCKAARVTPQFELTTEGAMARASVSISFYRLVVGWLLKQQDVPLLGTFDGVGWSLPAEELEPWKALYDWKVG